MKKLTKSQMTVMETLYNVATHEGGGVTLSNRYHSPAHALIRKGYVRKQDRSPFRPYYFITDEGVAYWSSLLTLRVQDGAKCPWHQCYLDEGEQCPIMECEYVRPASNA